MGKIAFIYPGQGAQKCFMGQDFYDTYEKSAEIYKLADEILDINVTELCFTENEEINAVAVNAGSIITSAFQSLVASAK